MNRLYYGDNLDVLSGGQIAAQSADLVYLDPPFNSNRSYNVIFARQVGEANRASAHIQAFDDTWHANMGRLVPTCAIVILARRVRGEEDV
jgi:16S rRNA G966 N2-methylase RsmD